ncbi:hypothetical protein PCA31118_01077 [Pandoraea captiosa]|uniref:Uncharacterized protein n=1 Tax=Pandoraea captiosa TaxID=2508302 RepID=A0A5E4ZQU4_9BURK|nr:hypothetical protein PCA31118_01077 [Pandoraea captiosa]
MGKREVGAVFLCMGNAAVRFDGAVGAAPSVKGQTRQGCVCDSSNVRVASEITLRSQRTSSE